MNQTIEITNSDYSEARKQFAEIVRAYRAAGLLRVYARLDGFGRMMRTDQGIDIRLPYWTMCPPMNIHRQG